MFGSVDSIIGNLPYVRLKLFFIGSKIVIFFCFLQVQEAFF